MYIAADYLCADCGFRKEEFVEKRAQAFPIMNCPHCKAVGSYIKVVSPVKALFKGDGFPTNDIKKGK